MTYTLNQLLFLASFPVAIAAGQILFKRAAIQVGQVESASWLFEVLRQPALWAALVLYGAATLLWVKVLATIPLSRAYPFVALAFVFVPVAGYVFFHESIGLRQAAGIALIVVGVIVAAR